MDGSSFPSSGSVLAAPQRIPLLGGEVDIVTPAQVLAFIAAAVEERRKAVVANHNLHSLVTMRSSRSMRRLYRMADLIEADSTPLIWWGRLLGHPIGARHRCTYLDWREAFWRLASERGWRVFYLGGAPGVAAQGAERIRRRWPDASITVRDGYFDVSGSDNASVLKTIRGAEPQVLLVGMGMPRQEAWIHANLEALPACVVLPVGAAFDYEAGAVRAAPRWMGRVGLEWLFRLLTEPGRLAHRYLVEPWALLGPAWRDLGRATRRPRKEKAPEA